MCSFPQQSWKYGYASKIRGDVLLYTFFVDVFTSIINLMIFGLYSDFFQPFINHQSIIMNQSSRLQIRPLYSFGNNPPQMVPRDPKYWWNQGLAALIQGQFYNPDHALMKSPVVWSWSVQPNSGTFSIHRTIGSMPWSLTKWRKPSCWFPTDPLFVGTFESMISFSRLVGYLSSLEAKFFGVNDFTLD